MDTFKIEIQTQISGSNTRRDRNGDHEPKTKDIIYTIRLKFSNFFIHHYFQNQMFENFTYALTMSSDAQIHVSTQVCMLFSRPRVATLRLKNHANHVPSIPRASHVINVCLV